MIALILSAGMQTRIQFPDGTPKQLLVFAEETLLARQVRQSFEHGITPIVITHDDRIAAASPMTFRPAESTTILHTLLSTRGLWGDRVIVLLGDVFYSPELMAEIVSAATEIRFWLKGAEIFAFAFSAVAVGRIEDAINRCIAATTGEWNGQALHGDLRLWHLLRALSGLDIHNHVPIANEMTTRVSDGDLTADVDSEAAAEDLRRSILR